MGSLDKGELLTTDTYDDLGELLGTKPTEEQREEMKEVDRWMKEYEEKKKKAVDLTNDENESSSSSSKTDRTNEGNWLTAGTRVKKSVQSRLKIDSTKALRSSSVLSPQIKPAGTLGGFESLKDLGDSNDPSVA